MPMAVELSLHGARAESHDRATATPGSFAAMLRGLDRLRERGVPLVLKTPVTRLNEDELDGMRAIAEAAESRSGSTRCSRRATTATWGRSRIGDAGRRACASTGRSTRRARCPVEERVRVARTAGSGRTTLAIDPEGNVFPCLQWRRAPLGNVRETPLAVVWSQSEEREAAAARAPPTTAWPRPRPALAALPVLPRARAAAHRRPAPAGRWARGAGRSRRARSTRLRVRFGAGGLGFSAGPDHALRERARGDRSARPRAARPATALRDRARRRPALGERRRGALPRAEPLRCSAGRASGCSRATGASPPRSTPSPGTRGCSGARSAAYPLETVIRTSLMARLPLDGGLPLHAAGVVLDGQAIAFFGPSGAGKSTLAATSPVPVLSDELVAIAPLRPFTLTRSGFWGEGRPSGRASRGPAPAAGRSRQRTRARARAAAAAGRRGPHPRVRPRAARASALWEATLAIVAELVGETRVYRPDGREPTTPPWQELGRLVREG